MKDYNVLNELVPKTQELHRAIFDKGYEQGFKDGFNSEYDYDHEVLKAYGDGQDYILDKIRKDIEQNAYPIVHGVNNHERGMTLYGILQVIDKYRERDDKE